MTYERRLLSIEHAAHYLGISPRAVRTYIATARLPIVRLGRRVLLDREVLDQLIREQMNPARPTLTSP
jgi:excisionase family DNA binding protein